MVKEKSTNLLLAIYIAVESYLICLILDSVTGRFWFSVPILNMLSVFAAYAITDTIVKHTNGRRRSITLAIVLAIIFALAISVSVVALYLAKLQLHAAYN